ncbi:MAG: hypothetical protein ACE5EA_06050, partial [Nitrospirota bacterium]
YHYCIFGGIAFGLALLSKYTGILLLPISFILITIWGINQKTLPLKFIVIFFIISATLFFLGYGGNIKPYIQGITFQIQHAAQGHYSYLLGKHSTSGWWYYFIAAFLLKTPIPTLILLSLSLWYFFKDIKKRNEWLSELFLLLPAAFIFFFFSIKHQSIGLRYILPIYPFIFIFSSKLMEYTINTKVKFFIFIPLLIWYIASSFYIHPHYLAYFNELGGGPDKGYQYLVDSNLDWGQDLKGLSNYLKNNKIEKIYLSYFGSDTPQRYGINYDWLPSIYLKNPTSGKRLYFPLKGWIAISATNIEGVYFQNKNIYAWLKDYKPVKKIGYSIFIYHIE